MIMLKLLLIIAALTASRADRPVKEGIYTPGEVPKKPVRINKENFQSMLEDKANPLWLLKFYAPW